eukprot:Gb_34264 [translate_table: standard]
MSRTPRQMGRIEVRLFSWGGLCHSSTPNCELKGVIEPCPGVVEWQKCSSGPLVGKLFFNHWDAAVEAVVFMWEQRLLGMHNWTPNLSAEPGSGQVHQEEINKRLRAVFMDYIQSMSRGESVGRCKKDIEAVQKELRKTSDMLRRRNGLMQWEQLERLKQGLIIQRDQVSNRLREFEKSLKCLALYLDRRIDDGYDGDVVDIDSADERPLFKLGSVWTWHQFHNIILRECKRLDSALPIYSSRWDIIQQAHMNQVTVLIGETGSGKSTQLVQFLADSGFGFKGSLVCTQPRKVAAMSLAQRVAGECKGCYRDTHSVSCCTSHTSREHSLAKITFMTDHVLLQLCMSDSVLSNIGCILVDEAHERSLSTDLLLALLKRCLLKRPELRLIIMSATADADTLSDYFCGCNIFHVTGRNFPVDIKYVANDEAEDSRSTPVQHGQVNVPYYVTQVIKMVAEIHAKEDQGAILAFLTSQVEVEWARDQFQKSSAVTLALHGKLSIEEQNHVFEDTPAGKRKVIFATNIAETSLTIPGVRYVVDCGMAKESRFDPKTGMNVLKVGQISRSAAAQRSGRAGRTQPGTCYRLYTLEDFNNMEPHRDPEILRVHLGIAILKLLALGVPNLESFDFVQAPTPEAINMAVKNLVQLGAVAYGREGLQLNEVGLKLVKLGVEPRLGKIILDSFSQGLGREGLVLAAVMANAGSIFCRVGTDAEKSKSDRLKVRFCHPDGDLFTLLSVYKEWEQETKGSKNKWCWENSINAKSMGRCRDAITEMELCLKHELNTIVPSYWSWSPFVCNKYSVALRRIILSSMAENLAMFSGYDRLGYDVAATGQQAHLHPSCSLLVYGHKPKWVVFGELLCSTRQYLVCVTAVEQDWVSAIRPCPTYDIFQLNQLVMQKKVIPGLGKCLLRRFCGKGNYNLHCLLTRIQQSCKSDRFGIEVDHDKQEIQMFSIADEMQKACDMLADVLKCERRWMDNECMEKCLFYASRGKHSPVALFGAGAEIKHLEMEDKFLSVEVCHPNVQSLDEKELLKMFDSCTDGIAGYHKYSGPQQEGEATAKWGMITFISPEAAQTAVRSLRNVQLGGSYLSVCPLKVSPVIDHKKPGFPAVKAMLTWPRRQSKGIAIIRCADEDVDIIALTCSGMSIGRSRVHCKRGRSMNSIVMTGLDIEVTEKQLWQALQLVTARTIVDLFILRLPAGAQPSKAACEVALLKELAVFVPQGKFQVVVHNCDPKDFNTRALVIFDGSIHLRAAMALFHLQGKVLSVCMPWQKISCQQTFYSTVLCPAPIYSVLKTELHTLIESLQQQNAGLMLNLDRTEYGSHRVKISSNTMEAVAKCRSSLEQLLKGTVVADDKLDPAAVQILFTREGFQLQKSLERQTKTCILFEKRNLSIKIFGPAYKIDGTIKDLVHGLMLLHESKRHEIPLRGEGMPYGVMKEIVNRFGADLNGLKELIPEVEFILDTRRHVLSVHGSREAKIKAGHVITDTAKSLKGLENGILTELEERANACPICFCDIEDCYRLEGCGHGFCRSCLVDQCNSAMRHHEGFPLVCAHENCNSLVLIADLKSLLSGEQLDDLFRASLGAFVASSKGAYRFCTTPDCPSVYEVSDSGRLFVCGGCSAELCTTCHLEYHPYLSCEKYREFKQDPDASLKEWCKGKEDVKRCPICGFTIEKTDGCNHINCKCGKHICWVCLESFDSSDICYSHLRSVHGGY